MTEGVIARSGNMEICLVPDSSTLIIRLRGFLKAAEFIKDRQMLNEAIHKRHIESILLNQQELKVLSQEVLSFLMGSANDFAKNGIKKMAIIAPIDPFAQAGITKVRSQEKASTVDVKQLSSEVAALEWLRS